MLFYRFPVGAAVQRAVARRACAWLLICTALFWGAEVSGAKAADRPAPAETKVAAAKPAAPAGAAASERPGAGTAGGTSTVAAATPAEVDLLARLVRAEAGGEPYAGKVAVAAVVLNRMRSDQFPDEIPSIINQAGQFEPVSNGAILQPADPVSLRAAREALAGSDPSNGALYFFAYAKVKNGFLWSLPLRTVIGGHRFVG